MQPDWDKLSKLYADTPNVLIAEGDCTAGAQGTCSSYGVQGYPTLKIIKNGKPQDYNGAREFNGMKQFVEKEMNPRPACSLESRDACSKHDREILEESEKTSKADRVTKIKAMEADIKEKREKAKELEKEAKTLSDDIIMWKAGGQTVDKVEQLINDADTRAHCDGRTCVIAFLPHIYDDQAAGRNQHLKVLAKVLSDTKKDGKSIGFLWSQGGDQFELEESLGLQFGFPAVIAVNFAKNRFGIHRGTGTIEKDSLNQFLTSLSRGGVPLAPIPANAKAVRVDPWDGKDATPPVEEEL